MATAQILTLPQRVLRHDHAIFAAAVALQTAHLLDEALIETADTGDGLAALAISVVAVAVYGRLAVWARVLLALLFGLAGIVGGVAMHVVPAVENGPGGADFSGFAHAGAGVVLLVLAAVLALRPTAH